MAAQSNEHEPPKIFLGFSTSGAKTPAELEQENAVLRDLLSRLTKQVDPSAMVAAVGSDIAATELTRILRMSTDDSAPESPEPPGMDVQWWTFGEADATTGASSASSGAMPPSPMSPFAAATTTSTTSSAGAPTTTTTSTTTAAVVMEGASPQLSSTSPPPCAPPNPAAACALTWSEVDLLSNQDACEGSPPPLSAALSSHQNALPHTLSSTHYHTTLATFPDEQESPLDDCFSLPPPVSAPLSQRSQRRLSSAPALHTGPRFVASPLASEEELELALTSQLESGCAAPNPPVWPVVSTPSVSQSTKPRGGKPRADSAVSHIDDQEYVILQTEEVTAAMADFVMKALAAFPSAKSLDERELRKCLNGGGAAACSSGTVTRASRLWNAIDFGLGWSFQRRLLGLSVFTTQILGWSSTAAFVYRNPQAARFVAKGLWMAGRWLFVLIL